MPEASPPDHTPSGIVSATDLGDVIDQAEWPTVPQRADHETAEGWIRAICDLCRGKHPGGFPPELIALVAAAGDDPSPRGGDREGVTR